MKKFNLPLTTAISAAILVCSACNSSNKDKDWQASDNTRVCVDRDGKRVPEDQCRNQSYNGGAYNGGGSGISPFLWYYIARGGYVPAYYRPAYGGSYQPADSVGSYAPAPANAPAGAVTRGGFGGIGGGHAEGGAGE